MKKDVRIVFKVIVDGHISIDTEELLKAVKKYCHSESGELLVINAEDIPKSIGHSDTERWVIREFFCGDRRSSYFERSRSGGVNIYTHEIDKAMRFDSYAIAFSYARTILCLPDHAFHVVEYLPF